MTSIDYGQPDTVAPCTYMVLRLINFNLLEVIGVHGNANHMRSRGTKGPAWPALKLVRFLTSSTTVITNNGGQKREKWGRGDRNRFHRIPDFVFR
jgi:hypothetical protein